MIFKLDKNLPVNAVNIFREAGFDACTVNEQDLSGTPGQHLFEVVQNEKRVLVTLDLGFSDIRAYPPREHEGIIVLRPKSQDIQSILSLIHRVVSLCTTEEVVQRLWIVGNTRLRIRE